MADTVNFSEAIQEIRSIAYALENLEVRGSRNLNILLGSIRGLNKTADILQSGLKVMEPEVKLEVVEEKPE